VDTSGSCRYCKSKDIVELYSAWDVRETDWYIYKCKSCNAVFLLPEPSEIELKNAYDSSYYGEGKNKFIFSVESFVDHFRRKKAKQISLQIPKDAKLLDVGCGNGRFLYHISQYGNYEMHGLEMEGGSAQRAAMVKEMKLKIGALAEDDYQPDYFDAITLFHVFEHLDKPKETLEIMSKIIKDDGLLVMSFPNISSWQAKIFKSKWYHLDPPRHLIFFAPVDFIGIMENLGFRLIRKKWLSFEQNPYGWSQSILNSMCKKREILYERLKGNSSYAPEYGYLSVFIQKIFSIFSLPFFTLLDFIESMFGKSATVQLTFRKNNK